MTMHSAKAKESKNGWYIRCPVCRSRIKLDECPVPGGMGNNIEICYECGVGIEVQPLEDKKAYLLKE